MIEPADCPTVRLREGGRCTEPAVVPFVSDPALQEENEVAQEPANGTCRYTCRRSNRDRFTLPFDVEFAIAEVEDRWSDRVSVPGEVLRDYASRSDRRFPVTFDQWPAFYKAEREGGYGIHGDLVHHIELVAPDGRVAYVYPKEGQYAEVAGITCGNAIGYRIVGDRSYREGSTTLDGGQFAIPSPAETSEIFQFGVVLGGGFFFLPDGDASQRPFGAATAVFRWEPRNLTEDWHLRWPIAVGVDVTYMISSQEFDSIGSFGSAANEADTVERRFRAYNRAFIRAGFDGPIVLRQFRIGQAVGLGGGWPTLQSAVSAVGGFDFQVLLTPLQAWYVVSNHLHIGTEFHILLSQRVHRYSICEDAACVTSGHGTPHRASAERWRPGWEVLTLRGLY